MFVGVDTGQVFKEYGIDGKAAEQEVVQYPTITDGAKYGPHADDGTIVGIIVGLVGVLDGTTVGYVGIFDGTTVGFFDGDAL